MFNSLVGDGLGRIYPSAILAWGLGTPFGPAVVPISVVVTPDWPVMEPTTPYLVPPHSEPIAPGVGVGTLASLEDRLFAQRSHPLASAGSETLLVSGHGKSLMKWHSRSLSDKHDRPLIRKGGKG